MTTNRYIGFTFFVLATITLNAYAELPPHVQRAEDVAGYICRNLQSFDESIVTPDIRADVIRSLQRTAFSPLYNSTSGAALVRLKDQQSIEKMLALTNETGWGYMHAFVEAGEPWIIPYLAPLFLRNDGDHSETIKVGDFFKEDPPNSVSVGYAVLRLLGNCREVSDEVRVWATKRFQFFPYEPAKFRAMLTAWWRANEVYFVNGEYHKVQPGPFAPIPPPGQDSNIATAAPAPPITSARSQPATTAAVGAATGSPGSYIAVATICVVLLVSLLLFWKRGPGT